MEEKDFYDTEDLDKDIQEIKRDLETLKMYGILISELREKKR